MKIDNTIKTGAVPRAKDVKSDRARGRTNRSIQGTVSDEVRLTDNSSKLRQLEAQLADVEATDAGRVESVRQAIAEGTFQVDEEAVADGLVKESLEFLSRQAKR